MPIPDQKGQSRGTVPPSAVFAVTVGRITVTCNSGAITAVLTQNGKAIDTKNATSGQTVILQASSEGLLTITSTGSEKSTYTIQASFSRAI